jgi:uncharacterized membrane protein YdfJ with MMPL/SSD domain
VTVRIGGSITTPTAINEVMVAGKIRNVIQIFAVVFIVAAIMFRSLRLGALILLPLAATLLAVFGVMGWAQIPLQVATATMAALAVGIGADYAIYLTWRLREELRNGVDEAAAIAATYATAGKAILFVATAVAAGYAALMASLGFNIHLWLGLLTSVSMLAAALSTLTLYAAVLLTVRPRVIFAKAAPRNTRAVPALVERDASTRLLARQAAIVVMLIVAGATLMVAVQVNAQTVAATEASPLMADSLKVAKPLPSTATGSFVPINPAG